MLGLRKFCVALGLCCLVLALVEDFGVSSSPVPTKDKKLAEHKPCGEPTCSLCNPQPQPCGFCKKMHPESSPCPFEKSKKKPKKMMDYC